MSITSERRWRMLLHDLKAAVEEKENLHFVCYPEAFIKAAKSTLVDSYIRIFVEAISRSTYCSRSGFILV